MSKSEQMHCLGAENEIHDSARLTGEIRILSQKLDQMISVLSENFLCANNLNSPKGPLIDVPQLAEILGLSPGTIYNKVSKKTIPCIKVGGSVRFSQDHVDQIIKKTV
jgi:excisionase family DNA binding protein